MRLTRPFEKILNLSSIARFMHLCMPLCVAVAVTSTASTTSTLHADEDSILTASAVTADDRADTELARLESNRDKTTTAAPDAVVVPTPLKLLAPVESLEPGSAGLVRDGLITDNEPNAMGMIPLPPESVSEAPRDVRIDPSKMVFAGTTNQWRVGDPVPGFFNANTVERCRYRMDPATRALQRVARKVGFRYLRRYFRSELKEQYRSDPSFSYAEYVDRRNEIGRLGRGEIDTQDLATEVFVESSRSEFSGQEDQIERDITLVEWGPSRLDDRGSLTCGLENKSQPGGVQFAGETPVEVAPEGKSIFCGKTYDLDSSVKFRPKIHEVFTGGDFEDVLGEIGGKMEIDFLTPILSRRYMTAEFELTHKADRGAGFFVNFVIYLK